MMQAERSDILGGRYDAIVVGTGAGGSSLAHRLGQQGLRVLVLERGTVLPTQAPTGSQMGRYITDVLGDRSVPLSFTGGQTKFYGAALYRLRQSDFLETRHEAGTSPAWPIAFTAPLMATRANRHAAPPTPSRPCRMGRSCGPWWSDCRNQAPRLRPNPGASTIGPVDAAPSVPAVMLSNARSMPRWMPRSQLCALPSQWAMSAWQPVWSACAY